MGKLSILDLNLMGSRVLLRTDFNVPLDSAGQIIDDTRIKASLPTIKYILDHDASVVIMSHLGRPKGVDPKLSLTICAQRLAKLLNKPVVMAPDCIGKEVEDLIYNSPTGSIVMLENLRFHKGEEAPESEPDFVESLARLGDVYVNDAFGTAHRAHASTALIAKFFPSKAAAGFLMREEMDHLLPLLQTPKSPFYAIIGGAKVSTKAGVIANLLKKVDGLFIGGAMAYTFFKAQNIDVGDSPVEESELRVAKNILENHKNIFLPVDLVVADKYANDAKSQIASVSEGFSSPWQGMDIGPKTIQEWSQKLNDAQTIFWNGPLGVYEFDAFAKGSLEIAKILASLQNAVKIVGGGDLVAAIHKMHLSDCFTYLSTGGGACLELLEYGHLPGIDALSPKL